MHTRTVLGAGLFVLLLASTAACGRAPEPIPDFRVRLMTSAVVSGRWERAAEQGLGRIAAELGAGVARLRADDEAERRALLRTEAGGGVDLIFCVGPGFASAVDAEASAHPGCRFVLLSWPGHSENVAGVQFLGDGAGYVAGAVAAHVGDGSAVGVVRGLGGVWLEALEEGFLRGFESVAPRSTSLTGGGAGVPWELVDQGVTVALYATDRAEPKLLAEARAAGLMLVAADLELLETEPELVIAAVHVDLAEAMFRVAREVKDESFAGGPYLFDLGSGVLDVVLNPDHPAAADGALEEALELARSEVTAGIVELEQLGI
jgi:basic membrane lipoprotein Med (substrate-binding protein (PBP1-ABC) superfamily)